MSLISSSAKPRKATEAQPLLAVLTMIGRFEKCENKRKRLGNAHCKCFAASSPSCGGQTSVERTNTSCKRQAKRSEDWLPLEVADLNGW